MRPGVARKYLSEVIEQYEKYAAKHYLAALDSPQADDLLRLAGLRFVATRQIEGHESAVREILTSRFMGPVGREIDAASLEALLATTEDPVATARFLARVATLDRPLPASTLCDEGLRRIGLAAHAALLAELAEPHQPGRRVKLARLLAEVSGVSSPEPVAFWRKAPAEKRVEALDKWRGRLQAAGLLPTPQEDEPPEDEEPWQDDDRTDATLPDEP